MFSIRKFTHFQKKLLRIFFFFSFLFGEVNFNMNMKPVVRQQLYLLKDCFLRLTSHMLMCVVLCIEYSLYQAYERTLRVSSRLSRMLFMLYIVCCGLDDPCCNIAMAASFHVIIYAQKLVTHVFFARIVNVTIQAENFHFLLTYAFQNMNGKMMSK